jgi:hypothetical protein
MSLHHHRLTPSQNLVLHTNYNVLTNDNGSLSAVLHAHPQAEGEARRLGRAGVQRPSTGAHQRAARHGGLRLRARRRGVQRRRPPVAGRQQVGAGVVRGHGGSAVRGVAGAGAAGGERRGAERRSHERRRRALERPLRHARPCRARRHRVHHRQALRQRLNY